MTIHVVLLAVAMLCYTGIKVVVLMILVGAVSGQMCPNVMNCISNVGVDLSSSIFTIAPKIIGNINELVTCYKLLPECPEMKRLFSSFLPSSTQIREFFNLLTQNKFVLVKKLFCMRNIGNDIGQCIAQIISNSTQQKNVHGSAVCGAIDCFTAMPSFQDCGSDLSVLITKAAGYLKPPSCTGGTSGGKNGTFDGQRGTSGGQKDTSDGQRGTSGEQKNTSGGQGLTGCLFLGLVMSFLISRISRRF